MSGAEVLGIIGAVIGILQPTIEVWNKAKKDFHIGKTFELVASRLPILKETLYRCYQHLEPIGSTIPNNEADALIKTLDNCKTRSQKLADIFLATISGEGGSHLERYRKVAKRWGKTTKVEDLMKLITEDVQIVVNYRLVVSESPDLNVKLEEIIKEMKSAEPSLAGDDLSSQQFNSQGPMFVSTGDSTMHSTYTAGNGDNFYYGGITGNPTFYVGGRRGGGGGGGVGGGDGQ